ncbi:MAG: hypothetical protein GY856_53260 [bacterium]|nr:hypothetical protein [bacterium]
MELHLSTAGGGGERMGPNDFQFLISCDGRVAVLQGDPLLASIDGIGVPKSERLALAIRVAAAASRARRRLRG